MVTSLSKSWLPSLVATVFTAAYTLFALGRHATLRTYGFDLGIFVQAVRSYAEGRLPVSDIRDPGLILLGDHFSPIIALIAPVFRLFPTAETLLVVQASLFGLSVFTVARVATRLLSPVAGVVIGTSYGLSWGLQTALAFDFHEIAFAVPLIALALDAYLSGRYRRAVAWAAPLVLVKEDLGLTVAVLGLLIAARRGHRGLGLGTAVSGLAAALLTVFVLIPQFSADGAYRYLGPGGLTPTMAGHRGELFDPRKLELLGLLLAPTLFLALRSPLVLLALPTLAWRLAGTNEAYWLPDFHYDAVLMPILFLALVDAAVRLRPAVPRWRSLSTAAAAVLLTAALVLAARFPLRELLTPGFGAQTEETAAAHRLLALIPDGVSVGTENNLMPQLVARTRVCPIEPEHRPEWTLAEVSRQGELAADIAVARSVRYDGKYLLIQHRRDQSELARTPQNPA
ncbi:DUF2079 domain-containing protein [Crossiella sp. SN42]|uniref:DUF2079 domain-containing protein n=1 Tax=Crossiella sp. SN42 TaxID=2944808 RepID=UPI00207D2CE3|nr:DUF2079 domain-containing protein [Crossiella sp. SN42]MCO1577266.1 DUF2079 domain-containing protein [Crossiella sp. SN42]